MRARKTNNVSLAALAATTLVVAACSSNDKDGGPMTPTPANFAPTVTAIADQTQNQDTAVGPIEFTIADQESGAEMLTVSATTDGNSLIPADGITLSGTGATRTITVTPLEATTGVTNVTVTVTDPQGAVGLRSFRLTVNARAASVREVTLATFAKDETDEATPVNGFTFTQDADDPATFEPLIPSGDE